MAPDHLVRNRPRDILIREQPGILGHSGVVDDLKQEIAKFIWQGGMVAPGNGIGDLIRLLDRVWGNAVEILRLVPGTAGVRMAQGGHDVEQAAGL